MPEKYCYTPLIVYTVAAFFLFMSIAGIYLFYKISKQKSYGSEEDQIGI